MKVWVEGVVRVVCGLSLNTSCQDVVIALAQAIGQTGRYILIMNLRGTERQLLKDDCPLKEVAQLGQQASDVHFILRRNGPSHIESASTDRLYPRTHTPDPEQLTRRRDPHKAFSFSQGPSTFPRRAKTNQVWSSSPAPSDKEALLVHLLQQTRTLKQLNQNLQKLERQTQDSEQDSGPAVDLRDQLELLEERQRQNEVELEEERYWRGQLEEESFRAQDLNKRLEQLQRSVHHQSQRLDELLSHSESLHQDVQQQSEEALRPLEQELQQRLLQGEKISAAIEDTGQEIQAVDNRVQMQQELLEELNKELRQCNLQQFILQASGPGPSDLTNLMPASDIYLSNAGILE